MTEYSGYAGKSDLAQWDGVTRTETRLTSSGGSLTIYRFGNEVDVVQVYGSQSTKTDATLQAAIDAIGSNQCELVLEPGAWAISNDVTIPATMTVRIPEGVTVTVASGKTLTILGSVLAGPYAIFAGSGSATVAIAPYDKTWWANAPSDTVIQQMGNVVFAFDNG